MCCKWASGELLRDWSIVILINLCNQHVREAKLLSDFLYYPDQAMREKIYQDLFNSKGKQVLFIIDGLDQLNQQQLPPSGSVYQQLVNKKLLPSATLMILSNVRCWRQRHHTDQNIQVSCFTKKNIDDYITSACSDDNDGELLAALKSYISSHPFIYCLMHIPAQCVMITDLYRLHWSYGNRNFSPNTLTELYTDLVRTLLLRYLSNHPEYSLMKWFIVEFTDLPDKAKESFMALAHLAAKGIEERKYIFDVPEDFETLGLEEFKTVEDFETFGLMQRVDEVYPGRKNSKSYSFLHLTLQEYMAAYYCSQQAPVERLQKVLISPFPLEQFLSDYCHELSFYPLGCLHRTVILFTVGLTKLDWDDRALSKILETTKNNTTIFLSALHLLYETQSPDLIQRTFSLLNHDTPASWTKKYGLLDIPLSYFPLDLFVTGYCIPHSNWVGHGCLILQAIKI